MAKSPKTSDKLKTASVLSFNRHLDNSDGRMTAVSWATRHSDGVKVTIQEKSVRGTISNRPKNSKETDAAAIDAAMTSPNLQRVDVAALPQGTDTLALTFSLRVLPNVGSPSACNDAAFASRLAQVVDDYRQAAGFTELAQRYALSLASGRFLWRNRVGAESAEVTVSRLVDGKTSEADTLTFDALAQPLSTLETSSAPSSAIATLASWIEQGFSGAAHVLLRVTGYARLGEGQEVYPSQELILDKGNSKGAKSKTLYQLPDAAAGLHSQKIGNALRSIDTWYADSAKPIAVEPYGSVTSEGRAYRQPNAKIDFYNLFDGWVNNGNIPEPQQQHYVMAVLIRGGVFGESDK